MFVFLLPQTNQMLAVMSNQHRISSSKPANPCALLGDRSMTVYQYPSHPLSPPNGYPSTPVGDAVSNLVSSNTKSLQYLPRSLLSLAPLAVLSPVYAATGTALSSTLISTGLVEPRLLLAATVVLNHRISHISCSTALY